MLVNFLLIQAAPGGPVEQLMAKYQHQSSDATARIGNTGAEVAATGSNAAAYRGAQGLEADMIAELNKQYGFDKPWYARFWGMLKGYAQFDFGNSFFQDRPVMELIKEKLPVSLSLGLWSTLIIYLISIPLGIRKAVKDGSKFDLWSSFVIIIGYAIPSFLFAMLLIVLFAGGGVLASISVAGIDF
jgi:microcin C transport system permease protein